ncbi:MAG: GNAT family N-acetyltransferase [Oscillatoriales cyanobacterium RM2_1_1]|nr:GNAT family N-acetyltransferase [Oscillatoriales cyanobacterium SM2_3_0]NJO47636.1 GNAT family N-acetyltransferase [Oscillatoriales cyanobacterium RM2_1_1]
MHCTYKELYPGLDFSHFSQTVDQYLSNQTPLWWVEAVVTPQQQPLFKLNPRLISSNPIACLWLGNAVDQVEGDLMAHIFLLYVDPQHRRRGIASELMHHAEQWAEQRGDQKISLQVFCQNQTALNLYRKLGYQVQALTLHKSLG